MAAPKRGGGACAPSTLTFVEVMAMDPQVPPENEPIPTVHELTPREVAVLALVVKGATSKAVGNTLGISPRTVEFHRANIMLKLSAKNIADLVRIVMSK